MTEQANPPPDPDLFEQLLEEAKRTDLSKIEERNVIYCCGMHEGDVNGQHLKMPVIVFIPYHLDTETPDDLHKGLLLFIKVMNQITNMPYILIYCHAGMSFFNRSYFSWFKNTLSSLPRRFRKNIKVLRILHPSFTIRLFFAFLRPFISAKFYRKINYDYSVEDLKSQYPELSLNLPNWLINYEDGILEPRDVVISEIKDENFKIDLLQYYQANNNTLPPYFEECIKFLQNYYDVEHLLRVPGSAKIVKESIHLILNDNKQLSELPDFSKITCHEASSILKNLLRHLSIPLVPKSYYEEIIEINQKTDINSESSVKEQEKQYKDVWVNILTHICDANKILLLLLFKFYSELSKHSENNHMNTSAIAAVITMGGYVVRSENEMDDITYFSPIAKFSSVLIDEYDEIVGRI